MDARVSYRAASVEAGKVPIRRLSMKVDLNHAVLAIDPLALTLPQGQVAGLIRIDGRRATPTTTMDLRLSGARLESLVPSRGGAPTIGGGLGGRARLTGVGNSVHAAASTANGSMAVVIPQGHIRQAFAELLGINATKGLFLLLSKDHSETPIRCAVAEFRSQNGVMTATRIVFDTGVVAANGRGWINLRDETLNLKLEGKSKKFRLVRVMAPITLKGSLEHPKTGVELSKAAGQIGIGAILGAVVSPLAAIIPFITPGGAKDADCGALLAGAAAYGAPVRR